MTRERYTHAGRLLDSTAVRFSTRGVKEGEERAEESKEETDIIEMGQRKREIGREFLSWH